VSNAPPRAGAGAPARGTSYWGHPLESNVTAIGFEGDPRPDLSSVLPRVISDHLRTSCPIDGTWHPSSPSPSSPQPAAQTAHRPQTRPVSCLCVYVFSCFGFVWVCLCPKPGALACCVLRACCFEHPNGVRCAICLWTCGAEQTATATIHYSLRPVRPGCPVAYIPSSPLHGPAPPPELAAANSRHCGESASQTPPRSAPSASALPPPA
jgi:hypothetical protein